MSRNTLQRGFTLMEIVAAMGIFSIILLVTIGAFSRFAVFQRRAIDEQAFQEDARLAIDLLNREIRTGYGDTYESANGVIAFRNQNSDCVMYTVESGALARIEDPSLALYLPCMGLTRSPAATRALTGADSTIIDLEFRTRRSSIGLDANGLEVVTKQGFVTVKIDAQAKTKGNPLIIQTTVASQQGVPYDPNP